MSHRWSGWPGAWCLDCGIEDPVEQCVALGHDAESDCPKCGLVEALDCPEPMSHRYDPYWWAENG